MSGPNASVTFFSMVGLLRELGHRSTIAPTACPSGLQRIPGRQSGVGNTYTLAELGKLTRRPGNFDNDIAATPLPPPTRIFVCFGSPMSPPGAPGAWAGTHDMSDARTFMIK